MISVSRMSLARQLSLTGISGLALLLLCSPGWAVEGIVRAIRYDQSEQHIIINASGPVKAMVNTLNIAGRKRIIIDLDNAEIGGDLPRDTQLLQILSRDMPDLRNVTVNQYGGNGHPIVRILLDLQSNPGNVRLVRNQGNQIELALNQPAGRQGANTPSSGGAPLPAVTSDDSDTLKRSLADLSQRYQTVLQDNQRLKERLANGSQPSSSLNVDDLKRTLVEMNRRYDQLTQENKGLKKQLEAKPATLPTLEAHGASAISAADLQKMRSQVTLAQQSLNNAIQTINEQNKEIAFLRNQVADVKAGLDASSKEQIAGLQTELDNKDNTIRDLQRQVVAKTTAPKASGNNQGELNALKRQFAAMSDQYQSDLRSLNQQLKEKNAQLQSLQTQADASRTAAGTASTSLREAMDRLTRENRDLQSKVDVLNQQKTTAQTGQAQQLQTHVSSLQQDLAAMTQKYNQAKQAATHTSTSKTPVSSSTKADPALQKQVADLNRQLADVRKENANLRDNVNSGSTRAVTVSNPEAEQDYRDGKAALAAKDVPKALDKLKEAQLLEPDNARYVTEYSSALAEDHQYAEAIDLLRRYLQRNPAEREAYNQLGKLYLLNDNANAANQAFTRALSISTLNNYATSLKKLGRMSDAEQVFKLALTMSPKDSEVLFNLGNLYNAENKLELARNKYLEAIQIKPDFAEAHYNLGLIFSKMGDNAKAVSHLEKFLQLSPHARNAETIRAYVQKLKA